MVSVAFEDEGKASSGYWQARRSTNLAKIIFLYFDFAGEPSEAHQT